MTDVKDIGKLEEDSRLVELLGSDAFIADPFPVYAELRKRPGWRAPSGYFVFGGYQDVITILKAPDVFGQETRPQPSFHVLDPPDHTRIRRLVSRAFTPRSIERRRESVSGIADRLIDECVDDHEMDLIEQFAKRLPAMVISSLLDIPLEDGRRWEHYLNAMTASRGLAHYLTTDTEHRAQLDETRRKVSREQADFLAALIEERRGGDDRDDIVTQLLRARDEDDALSTDEVLFTLLLFLGAGMHTTAAQIGNTMKLLLERPELVDTLKERPDLLPNALEEALRIEGSLQGEHRLVRKATTLAGLELKVGNRVIIINGSANHDPAVFPQPDEFNIFRDNAREHLTFGWGIHLCLGASLARLELQTGVEKLLGRLPGLRLAGPPVYQPYDRFRALDSLVVRWD